MEERESIRIKREQGSEWPWTEDEILQQYKFTNVKREHDKTTMKLKELFYENSEFQSYSLKSHFINCIIFRFIGKWETCRDIGYTSELDVKHIRKTVTDIREQGKVAFTSAYILPAFGDKDPKIDILIRRVFLPMWSQLEPLLTTIRETNCWEPLFTEMKNMDGFGGAQRGFA